MIKKPHLGYQLVERHFLGEKIIMSEDAADDNVENLETLNQLRGGSRRVAANGESKGSEDF